MRILLLAGIALLAFTVSAASSPVVSADDALAMKLEALADRAPDRIHGNANFILLDPDADVDRTSGEAKLDGDDCSAVPVRVKRSDGTRTMKRIDMCD